MTNTIKKQINNLNWFIFRWNEKAEDYKKQEFVLSAIFDEFITRFIIFNSLYKVCAEIYGEKGDRNSATNVVKTFLDEHSWSISSEMITYIDNLRTGIIDGRLKVGIKGCSEKGLIEKLQYYDLLTLLKCVYQIRCNLFHGEKEFIWRQELLLTPITRCLEILNGDIYQILKRL